jgi:hypothetical protein
MSNKIANEIRTPLVIGGDILDLLDRINATDEEKLIGIEIAKLIKSTGSWTKRPMSSAMVSTAEPNQYHCS